MKRNINFLLLTFFLILLGRPPLLADDSDIFGKDVQPNVLLLIDSSGSMEDEVPSTPYSFSTTYNTPLTYETVKVYRKFTRRNDCRPAPHPCYKAYANTINDVNSSSARDALSTTGYWTGTIGGSNVDLFYGNYLNYLACSSCSADEKKIVIAKRILTNLINNVNGVRFGAMKFASGGGAMIREIMEMTTANKTALVNAINSMSTTSVGTPTGPQIKHGGQYYKGTFGGYSSPIQLSCQPSFAIVISDGLYDGNHPKEDAAVLYTTDHRTDLSNPDLQNVIVHTIGFGLPQADKNAGGLTALEETATAGGGSFYTADDSAQLEQSLQAAISQIIAATFSFASPVVPTTGTSGSRRIYLASFQSDPARPFWKGYLKAYNLVDGVLPVDGQGQPTGTPAWEGGDKLVTTAASNRNIYTVVGGNRQLFTNSFVTASDLDAADNTERDRIIDYIRGAKDFNDENANLITTGEERPWKLGDIFHSTPVVISPPFFFSIDPSYSNFKSGGAASRPTVLIVGSNDGMVHAFKETNSVPATTEDGKELWGFIPPDLLSNLKDVTAGTGGHPFYADASPMAADVCTNFKTDSSGFCNASTDWKTVVLFGLRRGGKHYYALDVTDTTNPIYKWSFTDSKMGETWSESVPGKIKMADGSAKHVAFVAGGYDTTQNNNSGKAFYVVDLWTGAKLWEYYNNSNSDDRRYMNFSLPSSPRPVDTNNDGYVDLVYVGDVGGQMWKFDFSTPATISGGVINNWDPAQKGKRLFNAASSQPNPPAAGEYYPAQAIYNAPSVAKDSGGNVWVFFGTGDRNHPNNTTSPNRFYGIKDNTGMTNGSVLTESSTGMVDVTNVVNSTSVTQGWYVRLGTDEKVLAASDIFAKTVFFTTFTPTTAASCGGGGGVAKLYAVDMFQGDASLDLVTGQPKTGVASASAVIIGGGIPSRPIITVRGDKNSGTPTIITGTTSGGVSGIDLNSYELKKLVGWREVF